jgi:hypothetical protein
MSGLQPIGTTQNGPGIFRYSLPHFATWSQAALSSGRASVLLGCFGSDQEVIIQNFQSVPQQLCIGILA